MYYLDIVTYLSRVVCKLAIISYWENIIIYFLVVLDACIFYLFNFLQFYKPSFLAKKKKHRKNKNYNSSQCME